MSSHRGLRGRHTRFVPRLEALEDRCCPAAIEVFDSTLQIIGDSTDNVVTIHDDGSGTIDVMITGVEDPVTGMATGISRIVVYTQGGFDTINYSRGTTTQSGLSLGPEAYQVTMTAFTVGGSIVLTTIQPGFAPVSANQPPVLGSISDQTVSEASTLTFAVTATDPDAGQTLTFSLVDAPAGASIDPVTGAFTWTPDDGPATVTVTVRVTDSGTPALSDTRSFTIDVLNVAPTPSVSGPSSGTAGQTLSFTLTATDPSSADRAAGFTYVIDWGDGSAPQTVDAFPDSGSGVAVSHAYALPGSYTVRVTAIDKDGGSGTAELPAPVVIAPVPAGESDLSWAGGGILAPPPVAAGESFTIGRTFAVGGEPVGPFTIAYWASVDDIFGNEDDFLVGVEFFEGAAPGIHSGTSPAFTIGAPGTYFLFAVLDSDGQVNEIDEDNNLVQALFPIVVIDTEEEKD